MIKITKTETRIDDGDPEIRYRISKILSDGGRLWRIDISRDEMTEIVEELSKYQKPKEQ